MNLRDYLEKSTDPLSRYLVANGRAYRGQKLPKPYRLKLRKNCYWNARDLVVRSKGRLRYCEGKILCLDLGVMIALDHAWALDENDNVIDPTLQKDGESRADRCLYFGVVIELKKGERLFSYGDESPLYRLVNSTVRVPRNF